VKDLPILEPEDAIKAPPSTYISPHLEKEASGSPLWLIKLEIYNYIP
jgi:hypothetical protein